MHKIYGAIAALIALALVGCSAPQKPVRILWPAPPQTPRMEFIGVYYSQHDFDKSRSEKSLELLMGQPETKRFFFPYGIAADGQGVVYISDPGAANIRIFDFNQKTVNYLFKDPVGKPYRLQLDKAGRLFVVMPGTKNVLVYSPDHKPLFNFGSDVLEKPSGIALDEQRQRIYISEIRKGTIEVFDMKGKHLTTFGAPGIESGQLNGPSGLAVDRDGNIWVAEALGCRIQEFDPDGKSKLVFGKRGDAVSDFGMPKDLAFDSDGNLQIVDTRKGGILTYTPKGQLLLYTGMEAQSRKALGFGTPNSIFIDQNDRIYVADMLNKRFSVWQYLNQNYLLEHPVTEEDKQ